MAGKFKFETPSLSAKLLRAWGEGSEGQSKKNSKTFHVQNTYYMSVLSKLLHGNTNPYKTLSRDFLTNDILAHHIIDYAGLSSQYF